MWRTVAGLSLVAMVGCGPSSHDLQEQTLSSLNVEADRWEGGPEFTTTITDAYGRPVLASVEKGTVNYKLQLRSAGADGLPKNHDDIVVNRSKPHGESSISKEAANAAEVITEGAASGVVKGIKKGIGLKEGDKR